MSRSRRVAVLLAVVAAMSAAGCSDDQDSAESPLFVAPSAGDTAATSPGTDPAASRPAAPRASGPVTPPAEAQDELARTVVSGQGGLSDPERPGPQQARAEQDYWLHAACVSKTPGRTLIYEVHSGTAGTDDNAVGGGDITCDGQVQVDSLGELPAGPIVVTLSEDQSDITSAYAVVKASA